MSKPLFVLIRNCGDGSFYPQYTLDKTLIDQLYAKYSDPNCSDWNEYTAGVDADGFHCSEINVPDDATYESLGITTIFEIENIFEIE